MSRKKINMKKSFRHGITMPKYKIQKKIGELVPIIIIIVSVINTILASYIPSIIVVPNLAHTSRDYNFTPTTFFCILIYHLILQQQYIKKYIRCQIKNTPFLGYFFNP